ncbi:MAG TPA: XdhC family protein [Dongiaceae bacterium]|nr:XdhC family protein [Dongiaceae bacterium]
MQSSNEQVIRTLQSWLHSGHFCWLISIASTWGSSPRPAGSLLVWCAEAGALGSLSGGCVEDELLEKLRQSHFATDRLHRETYGISAEEATRMRLPCGGSLSLILEPLHPTPEVLAHVDTMAQLLDQRQGFVRTTTFAQPDQANSDIHTGLRSQINQTRPQPVQLTNTEFQNYLGPRYRLLLVGANQVAEFLADFARTLDFEILVCDPRPNAFDPWPHDFTTRHAGMPDDVVRAHANDSLSAVVTLSHDPRVDDMALMEALTGDSFYVGAMGSLRTTEKRLQRLQQLDLTPAQIARLHAPVGMAIGSKTPAEIALSIAADLVRHIRRSP